MFNRKGKGGKEIYMKKTVKLELTQEQFVLLYRIIDEIQRSPFTEKHVNDYNLDSEMSFTYEEWTILRHLDICDTITK